MDIPIRDPKSQSSPQSFLFNDFGYAFEGFGSQIQRVAINIPELLRQICKLMETDMDARV